MPGSVRLVAAGGAVPESVPRVAAGVAVPGSVQLVTAGVGVPGSASRVATSRAVPESVPGVDSDSEVGHGISVPVEGDSRGSHPRSSSGPGKRTVTIPL